MESRVPRNISLVLNILSNKICFFADGGQVCGKQRMFASSTAVRESSSAVVRELSVQIQQLRTEILNGKGEAHGSCHANAHYENQEHGGLILSVTIIKLIAESLSAVAVAVIIISAVGILPMIFTDILPLFFRPKASRQESRGSFLFCRMQLARGIMLGMDLMVAADVVETLLHDVDLTKLVCIVAIRSWLGFERSKEAQHISHEINDWKKAYPLLAKEFGEGLEHETISTERIRETFNKYDQNHDGTVSTNELKLAFVRVGLDVDETAISQIMGNHDGITFEQFEKAVRKLLQDARHHH